MQRWENGRSKERDDGIEVATEGRRGVEGKEDGGMETGAEREGKTERGQGERERGKDKRTEVGTNRGGTEGGMDGQMIETHNQLTPDLMKLLFH